MKSNSQLRLQAFAQYVDSACLEISAGLDSVLHQIPNINKSGILEGCRAAFYELLESIVLPYCVHSFRSATTKNSRMTFEEFFGGSNWLSVYPTLQEDALLQTKLSTVNITQAIRRLVIDWCDLVTALGITVKHDVVFENIIMTDSDRHNKGQQVLLLVFRSGDKTFKVLYKPRELSHVDCFGEFFGSKYMPGVYKNGQDYGWEEYIPHEQSGDLVEYYNSAGRLLVLYSAVNGTDAHFENIIAAGTHPVVVDWETVFTNTSYFKAQGVNTDLVTFTGLVQRAKKPWEFWISKKPLTAGFQTFGETKHELLGIHHINDGTTEFAVAYSQHVSYTFANRPSRDIFGAAPYLIDGFRSGVGDFLRMGGSVFDRLESSSTSSNFRQLIRHTAFYKWLMLQSLNPGILTDVRPESRRQFFRKHLKSVFGRSDFVEYEIQCLLRGDVPIFYQNPGRPDLIDGDGGVYKGFFPVTGLECLRQKWSCMRHNQFLAKNIKLLQGLKI